MLLSLLNKNGRTHEILRLYMTAVSSCLRKSLYEHRQLLDSECRLYILQFSPNRSGMFLGKSRIKFHFWDVVFRRSDATFKSASPMKIYI